MFTCNFDVRLFDMLVDYFLCTSEQRLARCRLVLESFIFVQLYEKASQAACSVAFRLLAFSSTLIVCSCLA